MKPHLKHIMYGDGTRRCGDTTHNEYVDDDFYRTLPECGKCFDGFKKFEWVGTHPALATPTTTKIERIVLRDFL